MLDICDHFVGQGMRMIPVGDPLKPKAVLLQEGFSNEEIRGAYQAWNFIDAALQSEADRAILKRCRSPREAFERLEKWHDPESEMATQRLYDKFHELAIPPHSNPITALHDLEDKKGIGRIPETMLHARFVRALPDEYSLVKETLQSMKNRDRDEIIRMISTRYSNLPPKKGAQRSSRQPEHALVSNESGGRNGARRGRGRRSGGGQGHGRGGSSNGAGGNSNSSERSRNSTGGVQGSSGRGGAAAVAVVSTCLLTAVFAVDRGAIGEKTAQRRKANPYPGAPGAQVLAMKRGPAHRTRRYWWWSCRYPNKTSMWKLRRSR